MLVERLNLETEKHVCSYAMNDTKRPCGDVAVYKWEPLGNCFYLCEEHGIMIHQKVRNDLEKRGRG